MFSLAQWYFEKNFKFFVLLFISLTNFCHWQRVNSYFFPRFKNYINPLLGTGKGALSPRGMKKAEHVQNNNLKKKLLHNLNFSHVNLPNGGAIRSELPQGKTTDVTNAHEVKLTSEALTCFPI